MQILIGIDDTDNLDSPGTGALASQIATDLDSNGWGKSSFITRHQLLVHPDIPYTSHNSSMCFRADIKDECLEQVIGHAAGFLARESAEGSDPGLCVVVVDQLTEPSELMTYGRLAKESVLTKESAYELARLSNIHLSEHGGTGQGVIGALAGAGLRLGGNDGRLKGQLYIGEPGSIVSVVSLVARDDIDEVQSLDGGAVENRDMVRLGEKMKTVLLGGKAVLLVVATCGAPDEARWQTCSRQQLKRY
ncbi:MAG: hypothetical protein PHY09_12945 [Desulfuromonadaceae bacterium]|nr:hypothetical protein [Desulfuromonadaceae bacterium]MDD5105010.1 hypothetical protein [Desulfuromonadaceae bacterium]